MLNIAELSVLLALTLPNLIFLSAFCILGQKLFKRDSKECPHWLRMKVGVLTLACRISRHHQSTHNLGGGVLTVILCLLHMKLWMILPPPRMSSHWVMVKVALKAAIPVWITNLVWITVSFAQMQLNAWCTIFLTGSILKKSCWCSLITWQEYSAFIEGPHVCFVLRHKISFAHYEQDFPYTCLLVLFRIWIKCQNILYQCMQYWNLECIFTISLENLRIEWHLCSLLELLLHPTCWQIMFCRILIMDKYAIDVWSVNLSAFWLIVGTTYEVWNFTILFSTYGNFNLIIGLKTSSVNLLRKYEETWSKKTIIVKYRVHEISVLWFLWWFQMLSNMKCQF